MESASATARRLILVGLLAGTVATPSLLIAGEPERSQTPPSLPKWKPPRGIVGQLDLAVPEPATSSVFISFEVRDRRAEFRFQLDYPVSALRLADRPIAAGAETRVRPTPGRILVDHRGSKRTTDLGAAGTAPLPQWLCGSDEFPDELVTLEFEVTHPEKFAKDVLPLQLTSWHGGDTPAFCVGYLSYQTRSGSWRTLVPPAEGAPALSRSGPQGVR